MTIVVWVIAILVSFVPMPFLYKIIGIVVSIILIAVVTYMAHRNNRLSTTTLVSISLSSAGIWQSSIWRYQLGNTPAYSCEFF